MKVYEGKMYTRQEMDNACRNIVEKVQGAVACGVVDLETGILLGIHNASEYSDLHNETVAAATVDLFRGPNVLRTEQLVRAHRDVPENGEHYMTEVFMTSKHLYHFAKVVKDGRAVIMLVTRKTTNLGLGWAQLQAAIPAIEPMIPFIEPWIE